MKRFGIVAVLAGCPQSNPPPQQPQPPPPSAAPPIVTPPKPAGEVPIDPEAEMPATTLSTDATLVLDTPASATVDARSDIYSSGLKAPDRGRGGVLPSTFTLAPAGGMITFGKVAGRARCMPGSTFLPDGGDCAGGKTDLDAVGSISGIVANNQTLFLVGVFLGAKPPAKAPPALDFSASALGTGFNKLEPLLGQVFFIGDGKTPSGDAQQFVIPKGATKLYLGIADGFSFQGTPGAYGDNTGGYSVTLTQSK